LSWLYVFSSLFTLVFILLVFNFEFLTFKISYNFQIWKRFLKMSWPVGLVILFSTIYNQIDSVMMGFWGMIDEVGWYNAAYKIVNATMIPATLFFSSFYPVMSATFKKSKEELQKIWNYQIKLISFLSFPILIGGIVFAPKIIEFFYGADFSPSILAFQILIIATTAICLSYPFFQILIVSDNQKKNFKITLLGAIVNVVLNLGLIPQYGLYGAAVATLITAFLMLFIYIYSVAKNTTIEPLNLEVRRGFLKAVLASFVMYVCIVWHIIYDLHVLLGVLIGSIIYCISFFVFNKYFFKSND